MHRVFLIIFLICCWPLAHGSDELVTSAWLKANKEANDIFLLDIQPPEQYKDFHIRGSINAPYIFWRTNSGPHLPGMLPPKEWLEHFLSRLGIHNNSRVVIIATGNRPIDMAAASRVFWTLKVMGHKKAAILDGGLADYASHFASDVAALPGISTTSNYTAQLNTHLIADKNDALAALQNHTQLLDARTSGEYAGVVISKPGERPGTIPGSHNLPFEWLVDVHGHIRDKQTIVTLFKAAGLDPARDGTIHFCHTGNRAALTWFADYAILGNLKAKLYDASISEWAMRRELPMETRIELHPPQDRRDEFLPTK